MATHVSTIEIINAIAAAFNELKVDYGDGVERPVQTIVYPSESISYTPAIMIVFDREHIGATKQTLTVNLNAVVKPRSNLPNDIVVAYILKDAIDVILEEAKLCAKKAPCKVFSYANALEWDCGLEIHEYSSKSYLVWRYTLTLTILL